jgi:hypothetical protein
MYKVKDYIDKKWNDLYKDTPTARAYSLGIAVGLLENYKLIKAEFGEDEANKIYKSTLDGTDEWNIVFRTLVGLYNDDTNSKVESMIEILEERKLKKEMTDDHRDLIEEFLEFLYRKEH